MFKSKNGLVIGLALVMILVTMIPSAFAQPLLQATTTPEATLAASVTPIATVAATSTEAMSPVATPTTASSAAPAAPTLQSTPSTLPTTGGSDDNGGLNLIWGVILLGLGAFVLFGALSLSTRRSQR